MLPPDTVCGSLSLKKDCGTTKPDCFLTHFLTLIVDLVEDTTYCIRCSKLYLLPSALCECNKASCHQSWL